MFRQSSVNIAVSRLEAINASWAYDDLIAEVLNTHRLDLQHLLSPPSVAVDRAPHLDDVQKATDYLGHIQQPGLRLAVRVRSFSHLGSYGHEFVLRANAPAGIPTEADKILTDPSSANVYLYAFTDIVGDRFAQYVLVDLVQLRTVWAAGKGQPVLQPRAVRFSATETGLVFDVRRLHAADCVIAASIVERTLTSQSQARAALQGIDSYAAMDPDQRAKAEILAMKILFHQAPFGDGSDS